MKERLLKRMSKWEQSSVVEHGEVDANTLVDSVRDDLEKLFNTRRGTVLIDENCGLPDFSQMLNGYSAPDAGSILQQLHLQAKQYEPRLQALHVKYVEQNRQPGRLQFQITGRLAHQGQDLPFNAFAMLSDDGSVSLSST